MGSASPRKIDVEAYTRWPAGTIPVFEANHSACYKKSGINHFSLFGEKPAESRDLNN